MSCGIADQVDDGQVDLDEVREVGEREVLGEQLRIGRDRRRSGVAGGQFGDDPRRGRADMVDVQFGLGHAGDEIGVLTHGGQSDTTVSDFCMRVSALITV